MWKRLIRTITISTLKLLDTVCWPFPVLDQCLAGSLATTRNCQCCPKWLLQEGPHTRERRLPSPARCVPPDLAFPGCVSLTDAARSKPQSHSLFSPIYFFFFTTGHLIPPSQAPHSCLKLCSSSQSAFNCCTSPSRLPETCGRLRGLLCWKVRLSYIWKTSINKIFLIFPRSVLAARLRDQTSVFSSGRLLAGISLTHTRAAG